MSETCLGYIGKPELYSSLADFNYQEVINSIDMKAIAGHIKYLTDLGSRVSGTPECNAAANYIRDKFTEYGLTDVTFHEFNVTVCMDYGASFTLVGNSEQFEIYSLAPNMVVPVTANITAPVIYVGEADLSNLDDKEVNGTICLMEWNTGYRWLNLAKFGAEAVIFVEPDKTTMSEEFTKKIDLPYYFPRYLMPRDDADRLRSILEATKNRVYAQVTSKMIWERKKSLNVIGIIRGTDYPEQVILLSSYYDSCSVAPSHSQGANDACGVASLLELARYFSDPRWKPRYTMMFVAFSGYYQFCKGSRSFIDDFLFTDNGSKVILQINLQLTTYSDMWATQGRDQATVEPKYTSFEGYLRTQVNAINARLGKNYKFLVGDSGEAINIIFPGGHVVSDIEATRVSSGPGWSFVTSDTRDTLPEMYPGSAFDTYDKITSNLGNLETQLEAIFNVIYGTATTDNLQNRYLSELRGPYRRVVEQLNIPDVEGVIAVYNITEGWWEGIPNALLYVERRPWGLPTGAPYVSWVEMADENGFVRVNRLLSCFLVMNPFVVNSTTGKLIYAPDYGIHQFAHEVMEIRTAWGKMGFFTVFKCSTAVLFDTIDPTLLGTVGIARSIESLDHYTLSGFESHGEMLLSDNQKALSMAVFFLPPEKTVDFLLRAIYLGNVPLGILVNASEENPAGTGYTLGEGEQYTFLYTPYQISKNIYYVSSTYLQKLEAYALAGDLLKAMDEIRTYLEECEVAIAEHRYSGLEYYSMEAWSRMLSLYGNTRENIIDISSTVVFLGLLLVPFALLTEMLFFAKIGKRKIGSMFAVYIITITFFGLIHPGFRIADNAMMTVIGLGSLLLILPLAGMLGSYVSSSIIRLTAKISGVHFSLMSKWSAMMLAVSVGVENIRRRKLRSALLFTTAMIIVVAVSMFTSISTTSVFSPETTSVKPTYQGLYIRPLVWTDSLGLKVPEVAQCLYGAEANVSARSWLYTRAASTVTVFYNIQYGNKIVNIYGAIGMTQLDPLSDEIEANLIAGRWFLPTDQWACIIADTQSQGLGITGLPAKISAFGTTFNVIGIYDSKGFDAAAKGPDGEAITPFDARILEQNFIHVFSTESIIIQYGDSLSLNAKICSVAVAGNFNVTEAALKFFSTFNKITIYELTQDKVNIYTVKGSFNVFGWQMQLVPLILASLAVLNVMIGSVQERKREIFAYSSVGLSPIHISFMFLAESLIYAVVATLTGYGIAVALCRSIQTLWPIEIYLKYSSTWVSTVVGAVMLIITGSTIYPMLVASKLVTPSLERAWVPPTKPMKDTWALPLPFVFTSQDEAKGVLVFLNEYLNAYKGLSQANVLSVEELSYKEDIKEGRPSMSLNGRVRLPPYERGVRQEATINISQDTETQHFVLEISLTRISGDRSTWLRSNRDFIDTIRKQFLFWRSFKAPERESYMKRIRELEQDNQAK